MKSIQLTTRGWFYLVFFSTLFLWAPSSYGQSNAPGYIGQKKLHALASRGHYIQTIVIPFKNKLPLDGGFVKATGKTAWQIAGENFWMEGTGVEMLANFIFEVPGEYQIDLDYTQETNHINGVCGDNPFPASILVSVLPHQFIIDFQSISMTNTLVSGKEMTGEFLSVDVWLDAYENQEVEFTWNMNIAGVDCSLTGNLVGNTLLHPGRQQVQFALHGLVKNPQTYVSIDFIDPQTGQTFSHFPVNPIY